MASIPSSSRFDVFLSFRGEDTRYNFTDHLYDALVQAGFETFRDNDEIRKGRELKKEFKNAITESRASIVVLSERYADSGWCLDELCLILDQRRKGNHFVLPVFYHVNPSDVRNQRRSFAIKVEEGVEGSKWTEENVNRWKTALTDVADLAGETVSGSEKDVIARLVDSIDCELDLKLLATPVYLTGMETRAEVINSWLKDEQSSANVLAICGMGGSGKTTLAQYIYNLNKQNFECSSFIEITGKHAKQPDVLIGLQRQLLSDVLGRKNVKISNVSHGMHKIEKVLQRKRVLIILDDIEDHDEVITLLGTKAFYTRSKIIITARFLDMDAQVYKLELLNDIESLELLSLHAFGSEIPLEGFKELAIQLARYCGGNPLGLKVLGSSLRFKDEDPRKRNSMIKNWRSKLNSLNSLQGNLDKNIQNVLQKSFHSLQCDSHKELFLHIVCFFVGDFEEDVIRIMEDDWHAKSGIMALINRCLLTVSSEGKLMVHQLLQDMGRKMVNDESTDHAERSRLWCSDEAYHVLKDGEGSKKIQGLSLDIRKLKRRTKQSSAALTTDSLVKMKNLKLLQLIDVKLTGSYKNFPELRWLCWHGCHLKTIPPGLLTSRLLVIDMSNGYMKKFEPPAVLYWLTELKLQSCRKLVSICGFDKLPKLERLLLGYCISLTHVSETICLLESLDMLELTGCTKLLVKTWFFSHRLLKTITINYCNLECISSVYGVPYPQSCIYMTLRDNQFEYLPMYLLPSMLRALDLSNCPNLKSLLCLPNTLEELCINWCTSLQRITFESACFRLKKFSYEGCFKLSEIQDLFKLVPVVEVDEASMGDMQWIKAYQHHKVELVGDDITKGRNQSIQMLYEYGIRSTFVHSTKHKSTMTYEYRSSSDQIFFVAPSNRRWPSNLRRRYGITGLNVSVFYRSSGEDKDRWGLMAKISNITKGCTWVYNPVVYGKPKVDEDVVWFSYWPVDGIECDDLICVVIFWEDGLKVTGCDASFVYGVKSFLQIQGQQLLTPLLDQKEELHREFLKSSREFEVARGWSFLCRRDFFKSMTIDALKVLFDTKIDYNYPHGWNRSRQSMQGFYPDVKPLTDSFPNVRI